MEERIFTQTSMDKTYARYAEIVAIQKQLDDELQELKDQITGYMLGQDIRQLETSVGKFTLAERAQWKYTANIDALNEQVKKQKKLEEEQGQAKASTLRYLTFKG